MILNIIILLVGLLIFGGGLYYLLKERVDRQSRNIYGITTVVGAVIIIAVVVKAFILV